MSIPQAVTLTQQGETARRRLLLLLDAGPAFLPSLGIPRPLLPLAHTVIQRIAGSLLTMEPEKLIRSLHSTHRMLRAVADSALTDEQFAEEVASVLSGNDDATTK